MSHNQPPLWTRSFILICLTNLLCFLSFHMLMTTFPFFVKDLGGNDAVAGAVAGLFSITSLLMRPLVGWGLDHISRRAFIVVGLSSMVLITASYSLIRWLPAIIILRLLHGVAWACSGTSNNTNISDAIPRERFGEGMGYYGVMATVSLAIAPALGLLAKDELGFRGLFLLSGGLFICALIMVLNTRYATLPQQAERPSLRHSLKGLVDKDALPSASVTLLLLLPYGGLNTFIALYAAESGVGSGGLFFTCTAISCVLFRIIGGRLADSKGERPLMIVGSICMGLSLVLLAFFPHGSSFLAAGFIYGIGFGMLPPALQTMAVRIAPPARRGAASSTYLCAFDAGLGLGSIISGLLVTAWGHNAMFALMLLPLLASVLLYFCWAGHTDSAFQNAQRILAAREQAATEQQAL